MAKTNHHNPFNSQHHRQYKHFIKQLTLLILWFGCLFGAFHSFHWLSSSLRPLSYPAQSSRPTRSQWRETNDGSNLRLRSTADLGGRYYSSDEDDEEESTAARKEFGVKDDADEDEGSVAKRTKSNVKTSKEQILRKRASFDFKEFSKDSSQESGKIAWLMSFPNSGTSFTSLLVRHASNYTTASNYGMESHPGSDGMSVPVYDWSNEGPYWLHPPQTQQNKQNDDPTNPTNDSTYGAYICNKIGTESSFSIPPSTASIFTKTHCGSRCTFCPPDRYLEDVGTFLTACLSGSRRVPRVPSSTPSTTTELLQKNKAIIKKQGDSLKVMTTYRPHLVEKAVHLIRNPFDNLVSRFHHEQKEHAKKKDTAWTKRYPNTPFGFRKWCADDDQKFHSAEDAIDWDSWGYPDIARYLEGVACHAEFFRYAQWHNMALQSVHVLEIPVLFVYYEDYSTKLEETTDEILHFLNMKRVGALPDFDSEKDYSEYFTREERASASDLMRRILSREGGELLERYWVSLDFDKLKAQTKGLT